MEKITQHDKIIVGPITNETDILKIKNVMEAHGVFLGKFAGAGPNWVPGGVRIAQLGANWAHSYGWYNQDFYKRDHSYVSPNEFLEMFQVPFTHEGYEGSYEYSDGCWNGKIVNTDDLVTYESSTLVRLEHEFVAAVNNYIETLKELKEKNMKELKWKVELEDSQPTLGYCIVDGNGNYLIKDGATNCRVVGAVNLGGEYHSNIYFEHKHEAEEFIEDMIEECPEKMFKRKPVIFLEDEHVDSIVMKLYAIVDVIVEELMENAIVFTRHDVLKSLRQIYGPQCELAYSDWKDIITEAITAFCPVYDYESEYDHGHIVYSPIELADEDAQDAPDTTTADSANTTTIAADTTPADTSVPKVDKKRATLTADFIRRAGGYPGAKMDIIVCPGKIYVCEDADDNEDDRIKDGAPQILLHTSLKVDCNCNLRLSKYMFDLSGLPMPS